MEFKYNDTGLTFLGGLSIMNPLDQAPFQNAVCSSIFDTSEVSCAIELKNGEILSGCKENSKIKVFLVRFR